MVDSNPESRISLPEMVNELKLKVNNNTYFKMQSQSIGNKWE